MEALSASIAHEVNQPLASMVTNADAGLRWLGRNSPELEEARAALKRIASDGHRAGKVIEGIRMMRSEEHTSELQSLMRNSYAVFRLTKKIHKYEHYTQSTNS